MHDGFYLVNTRMRSKRDIKMARLCTRVDSFDTGQKNMEWKNE